MKTHHKTASSVPPSRAPNNVPAVAAPKYPLGSWVRFYQEGKMVVGVVQYVLEKQSWEPTYTYLTDLGPFQETAVLEARISFVA